MNSEYLSLFIDEMKEHLQNWSAGLLAIEQTHNEDEIPSIFRAAHTIKGMAMTMGFQRMGELTHHAENLLDGMRNGEISINTEIIDVLFKSLDTLETLLNGVQETGNEPAIDIHPVLESIQLHNKPTDHSKNENDTVEAKKSEEEQIKSVLLPNRHLTEDPHVLTVINDILQRHHSVLEIGIRLNKKTVMKSVRIYKIFEDIGGQDQIIYTQPSITEIENEEIGTDVLLIMWSSDQSPEEVLNTIDDELDVELVELREWNGEVYQTEVNKVPVSVNSQTQNQDKNPKQKVKKKMNSTVRVDTEKLDTILNLFSELVIDKTRLEKIQSEVNHEELPHIVSHMSHISRDLQDVVMSIRMIALESVFNRFPRMVRDTALKLGKEVEFEIIGQDTELDRTIVEELADPIMHMLRNSLDHGLESTEDRLKAGKPEKGKIVLQAYSAGNSVFIEVEDDGQGIDRDVVFKKAVKNGLVDPNILLSDEQVYQLLFASGFSTSESITDLSGRGVGLDVVKAKIESLSGRVEIESEKGIGTKFIIQLPMNMSIVQGLKVMVEGNTYIIPLVSISKIEGQIQPQLIGGKEVAIIRDEIIPLVRIRQHFGLSDKKEQNTVFIHRGKKKVGLVIDSVLGQQEVVLKALGSRLRKTKWFSGGTILGDGSIALILDPNVFFDLI